MPSNQLQAKRAKMMGYCQSHELVEGERLPSIPKQTKASSNGSCRQTSWKAKIWPVVKIFGPCSNQTSAKQVLKSWIYRFWIKRRCFRVSGAHEEESRTLSRIAERTTSKRVEILRILTQNQLIKGDTNGFWHHFVDHLEIKVAFEVIQICMVAHDSWGDLMALHAY